jgi:phospholipase/carboxylesterase
MLDAELVPAREPDSRRLMVVLHGLGDSMEGYRWMPTELDLPYLNYLLVNAPDDYFGGFSWYDIYGEAGPGVRRSRALLFELLDAQRERGFPAEQTVVFGFSQGGLLAIEAGARYPHRLAGLIAISAYVHDLEDLVLSLSPVAAQQRFLMTHGTYDPLIPIEPVRQQVSQLRAAGLNIQWGEFAKPHTIAGAAEIRVIREFVRQGFRAE